MFSLEEEKRDEIEMVFWRVTPLYMTMPTVKVLGVLPCRFSAADVLTQLLVNSKSGEEKVVENVKWKPDATTSHYFFNGD